MTDVKYFIKHLSRLNNQPPSTLNHKVKEEASNRMKTCFKLKLLLFLTSQCHWRYNILRISLFHCDIITIFSFTIVTQLFVQ